MVIIITTGVKHVIWFIYAGSRPLKMIKFEILSRAYLLHAWWDSYETS
jgi:hypothetical protein